MGWLQTLGLLWVSTTPPVEKAPSNRSLHEPVLKWRLDIVPDLQNSTSVQYSGVSAYNELLYLGTSNRSGVLLVDHRYGVRVGRLSTLAPVQATPTILNVNGRDQLFAVDLSGMVYAWELPTNSPQVMTDSQQSKPKSDRSLDHQVLWETSLDIPVNTPIQSDGENLFISTNNDIVYALDLDGKVMWRFAHKVSPTRKGNLQLFGAGNPLILEDSIVVGFSDGAVLRFSKKDGAVLERVYNGDGRYPDVIAKPAVIQGGILISGFEQPSYKEDKEGVIWSQSFGSVQGAIVDPVEGNKTLVYHAGSDGLLRKLDTTTGSVLWEWDSDTGAALTEPLWFEGQILIASHVSGLFLIDSSTGKESWRTRLHHRQTGYMHTPLLHHCSMYGITTKGFLEEYRVCDKTEQ